MSFLFLQVLMSLINYSFIHTKLLNVIAINRHGARTSFNHKKGFLSTLFGENMKLTPNGFRQHQLLGKFIRNKYITDFHFLNEYYVNSQLEIFSTQTQRTIFSAEGFISGLYPGAVGKIVYESPNVKIISNDTIPVLYSTQTQFKEIEIKVIDIKKDKLFHPLYCLFKGQTIKNLLKETDPQLFTITDLEIQTSINEIADFLDISLNDSANVTNIEKMTEIQKLFFVNSYHLNRNWNSLSPNTLFLMRKIVLNKWYSQRLKDSKYLKLSVSAFFDTILNKFEEAKKKQNFLRSPKSKMFTVYSAHDSNLVSILSNLVSFDRLNEIAMKALNDKEVFDFLVPPFASSIIFELHLDEKTNELYVMIYYNGKVIGKDLKIINDKNIVDGRIPFKDFKELFQSRIDQDYNNLDCSKINTENDKENDKEDLFLTPEK